MCRVSFSTHAVGTGIFLGTTFGAFIVLSICAACAGYCLRYIKKTIARRREARQATIARRRGARVREAARKEAREEAREAAQRPAAIRAVGGPRLRPGPWSPVVPSKHVLLYVRV